MNRDLKELALSHELNEWEVSTHAAQAFVDNVADLVYQAIEDVESEDEKRALHTLDNVNTNPVKLPFFEGKDEEDFSDFKDKVEKAFVQNRTSKKDQLFKLREVCVVKPNDLFLIQLLLLLNKLGKY